MASQKKMFGFKENLAFAEPQQSAFNLVLALALALAFS